VEHVPHPRDALDGSRRADEVLDLALALQWASQVDDAVLGINADVRLGDTRLAEHDALDLARERDVVEPLPPTVAAGHRVRGAIWRRRVA
jgi:hypothetical protein